MSTQRKASIMDKIRGVPTEIMLTDENTSNSKPAKTGPGAFGEFLARESDVIKENHFLQEQIEVLKNQSLRVDLLVEVPGRKRVLPNEEFEQLKENIRKNDLETPITVRPLADGRYEVISGHNRVQVFRDLGRSEIFAAIKHVDSLGAERGAFYANLLHNSLPDYEKYQGFKRLMSESGKTQLEISEESGFGKEIISRLMDFDELSKETRDLISKSPSGISYTLVSKLKGLPAVHEAIQAVLDGKATHAEALAIATAKPKVEKISYDPTIIKRGNKKVAELVNRNGTVVIKFKEPDAAQALMGQIEALIREFSSKN